MRVDRERLRPTVAPGPLLLVVLDEIILDGDWEPWLLCVLAGGLLAAVVGVRRAAAGIGGFLLLGVDMLKAIGIVVAGACFCYLLLLWEEVSVFFRLSYGSSCKTAALRIEPPDYSAARRQEREGGEVLTGVRGAGGAVPVTIPVGKNR